MLVLWTPSATSERFVQAAAKPNIRAKVAEKAAGAVVEVKLEDKRKLRGRLVEIDDNGFGLQFNEGNQIRTERLFYTDVRSIKEKSKGISAGARVGLGALADVGGFS